MELTSRSVAGELERIFDELDGQRSPASYLRARRAIAPHLSQLSPLRVGLLASFTVEPLVPYLEVEAARRGLAAAVYVAPFNTAVQELLTPTSQLVRHDPDIVFVAQLLTDVAPQLAHEFAALSNPAIEEQIEAVAGQLDAAVRAFRGHSAAPIVVHNFERPRYPAFGIFDASAGDRSQAAAVRRLNECLLDRIAAVPSAYLLDYDGLVAEVGSRNWHDRRMWHLAHAPLSAQALPVLGARYVTYAQAVRGLARKCLVVDLDNTFWGGVIGEVGPDGIALGARHPGSAYLEFQRYVHQLRHRGVLLAINSKNNEADVREVFESHPSMVLRLDDFAAWRINWQDKAQNMIELADELRIGLDSLVFCDDNPVERRLMREALPAVLTIELPTDPAAYVDALHAAAPFERLAITREDRARTTLYAQERARRELARTLSIDEFLASLDMAVRIEPARDGDLPRVVDLLQKTNQFNMTTRRHSAARIAAMMADAAFGVFTLRLADRFGDSGTVGVAIVEARGDAAVIDTLLLSCRVIGRNVETALLAFLADWAGARGLRRLEGEFIATPKNAPAADFFPRHRFLEMGGDGATMRWTLDLGAAPEWPAYIRQIGAPECV